MSFCTNCGKQIPDTAKFCTSCGATLAAKVVPSQSDAQIIIPPATTQPVYQSAYTKTTGKSTWITIAVIALLGFGTAGYFLFFNKKQYITK